MERLVDSLAICIRDCIRINCINRDFAGNSLFTRAGSRGLPLIRRNENCLSIERKPLESRAIIPGIFLQAFISIYVFADLHRRT